MTYALHFFLTREQGFNVCGRHIQMVPNLHLVCPVSSASYRRPISVVFSAIMHVRAAGGRQA